ncbi:hypothetical protein T310_7449 [Rasamsonia emersonii CBS 393.64]|uniref:Uncharacterized protein n=1 Tax=Rasamsonia emersonii (strain ATCC 16479 / CBS 393.64 / IMI 116815) TaxID=1408163 RepID=A0A0F4YKC7_RASE3|nr:hypothetical protein T310_7449 [Rasamsonia emersonii CBS 393.64]KKA18590.1 hypothetical protein T310_7449 [Rasamsonia emersonii CBS 393.64]
MTPKTTGFFLFLVSELSGVTADPYTNLVLHLRKNRGGSEMEEAVARQCAKSGIFFVSDVPTGSSTGASAWDLVENGHFPKRRVASFVDEWTVWMDETEARVCWQESQYALAGHGGVTPADWARPSL